MISYPPILADIKGSALPGLRQKMEMLSTAEAVEVATFLGPARLTALAAQPASATSVLRPAGAAWPLPELLAQISQQAFRHPIPFARAILPDADMVREIATALRDVEHRRRTRPLLTMSEDVTNTLPTPSSAPAALDEADYQAAAVRNAVDVAAIKAVATVESGGRSGFDTQGRPKILFEAHYFGRLTAHRYDTTHPHLSTRHQKQGKVFYGWDQYERLREALVLDIDAALQSASWGKFQVMGRTHDGWGDVRSFVAAMYASESNHLKSFEAHCNAGRLFDRVRRKDWTSFAVGYNGPKQDGYDTKIAAAYRSAGGR